MDTLSYLGYIEYTLDVQTKKLTYKIIDYVVKCSGEPCLGRGTVYATDGYGFICLPRGITQQLADDGYTFEEADAWLDLWCHTAWQDPRNIFSFLVPVVQIGYYGAALTLETLGQRWGWEKTKVWRFLQKHQDAFTLHKLPGAYGCLIFNTRYPAGEEFTIPDRTEPLRILGQILIAGRNTHLTCTHNERINRLIALYSQMLCAKRTSDPASKGPESRVAVLTFITRAYFSPLSCRNCDYDCQSIDYGLPKAYGFQIREPCHGPQNILGGENSE